MMRLSLMKFLLCGFVAACIATFVVLLVVVDWPQIREDRAQFNLCPNIQTEFGVKMGAVHISESDLEGERVQIESVTPGGVFANSGFSGGEVLIDDWSLGGLCRYLDSSRGKVITLQVVQGGTGGSLSQRKRKAINISVPEKNQP